MIEYSEKYIINELVCGIEKYAGEGYKVWHKGCGIAITSTIGEARKRLHAHMISRLRAERADFSERAAKVECALTKLGDDEFNLGRFRDD